MSDDVSSEDDDVDLTDTYGPVPEYAVAQQRTKTEFEAWHHPRKQYVRVNQWCAATRELVPELGLSAGDPFRYLTLPGNELLDVRALHGVCERAGILLRYLGFNSVGPGSAAQAELSLSQDEVRSLSHVDGFSRVMEDRLEAVANVRSPAFSQTQQSGPFHAINLDLCDSIAFREIGSRKGSPLAAVGKLLELQLQSTHPWLLFITTKATPDLIGEFARDGFSRALGANLEASSDFRGALARLVEGNLDQLDEEIRAAWTSQDVRFLRLFCAGLGKWLLTLLNNASPPRELILLSSCFYQSGHAGPDMLSLAFRCNTPAQVLNDPFEILPPAPTSEGVSEVESAIRLTEQVGEIFDLDATLAGDKALQEHLIGQAGRLLATARFEAGAYEVWARERLKGSIG